MGIQCEVSHTQTFDLGNLPGQLRSTRRFCAMAFVGEAFASALELDSAPGLQKEARQLWAKACREVQAGREQTDDLSLKLSSRVVRAILAPEVLQGAWC